MAHPFVGDVGDLMDKIKLYSNLRIQGSTSLSEGKSILHESDELLKTIEYEVYDLLDQAKESGIRSEVATHHS